MRLALAGSIVAFMSLATAHVTRAQTPAADLVISSVTNAPPSPVVGSDYTYTITMANNGPNSATGVVVTDVLSGGVTFVSGTAPGGPCTANCGTVSCPVGNLFGSATLTITVTATMAGTMTNVAAVAGNEYDPTPSNNSQVHTVVVTGGPAPTVSGISPPSGSTAGGTPVIISGSNFQSGATAAIGGVPATGVVVASATQINATTGAHAPGLAAVIVTNPDNQSGSLPNGFSYACPTIALSPPSLPQGSVGIAYSQTLVGGGGSGPYSFSVGSGTLPAGLTLSAGGLLSGTPTTDGIWSFSLTATDAYQPVEKV